jgi:hypothetical protein
MKAGYLRIYVKNLMMKQEKLEARSGLKLNVPNVEKHLAPMAKYPAHDRLSAALPSPNKITPNFPS